MEQKGIWLSLMDYAAYRNLSMSTVRRYIKANRVKYKSEQGKYLIFVADENLRKKEVETEKEVLELKLENERLKTEIRRYQGDIEDLKTLLMAYESHSTIPAIPSEGTDRL